MAKPVDRISVTYGQGPAPAGFRRVTGSRGEECSLNAQRGSQAAYLCVRRGGGKPVVEVTLTEAGQSAPAGSTELLTDPTCEDGHNVLSFRVGAKSSAPGAVMDMRVGGKAIMCPGKDGWQRLSPALCPQRSVFVWIQRAEAAPASAPAAAAPSSSARAPAAQPRSLADPAVEAGTWVDVRDGAGKWRSGEVTNVTSTLVYARVQIGGREQTLAIARNAGKIRDLGTGGDDGGAGEAGPAPAPAAWAMGEAEVNALVDRCERLAVQDVEETVGVEAVGRAGGARAHAHTHAQLRFLTSTLEPVVHTALTVPVEPAADVPVAFKLLLATIRLLVRVLQAPTPDVDGVALRLLNRLLCGRGSDAEK